MATRATTRRDCATPRTLTLTLPLPLPLILTLPTHTLTRCDAKDPTPLEAGAALRWYRKTNDQCAACGENSLLWFTLMLVGFSVLAPLAVLASRLLLNLKMLPYVSPALAFVSFAQFVSEFRGFGEIWPPSVVALLDFFETLWTLNLESLNSECAVGRVLFPSSYWGRRVTRML